MRIKKLICFLMIIIVIYSAFTLSIYAKIAVPHYRAKTADALVKDWKDALNGKEIEYLSVNADETYLIIPKVKNWDLTLSDIRVYDTRIKFFYTSNDSKFSYVNFIVDRRKNSFLTDVNGLEVSDGKAVHNSVWYIDCDTHTVSIEARKDGETLIKDASELDDYFDFEIVDLAEKSPSWKMPVIVGSCAVVVAVAALGTLVVVKKKKSK